MLHVVPETMGREVLPSQHNWDVCQWLVSDRKPPARPQHTLEQHTGGGDNRESVSQSFQRNNSLTTILQTSLLFSYMYSSSVVSHCAAEKDQFQRLTGKYKQKTRKKYCKTICTHRCWMEKGDSWWLLLYAADKLLLGCEMHNLTRCKISSLPRIVWFMCVNFQILVFLHQ